MAEAGNRPERVVRAYYLLQRHGIAVRYRVIGTGGGPGTPLGSMAQTIKIEVHHEDEQRAREIIRSIVD